MEPEENEKELNVESVEKEPDGSSREEGENPDRDYWIDEIF